MTFLRVRDLLLAAVLAACLSSASGAPDEKRPYIGYVYTAGGRQGTTIRVTVGGQNLRGARQVYISGGGVHATVKRYRGRARLLNNDQRRELGRQVRRLVQQQVAALTGVRRNPNPPRRKPPQRTARQPGAAKRDAPGRKRDAPGKKRDAPAKKQPDAKKEPVTLPKHPLLNGLEKMSLRELKKVMSFFFDPTRRQQLNPQIAETVQIEVVIDPDATPGNRELRLGAANGLTNPVVFQVGQYAEVHEKEINDFTPETLPAVDVPRVLNGQVLAWDVDRFRFSARKGQKLVIEMQARRLVPYLADAVPGWFQATLTLRDAKGSEVAFSDDFRFDPDPVLLFEVPENGEYEIEVRDSIYRGREDFVYRITIGEKPFITEMFPLGGREGVETIAEVTGWNLEWTKVPLDTRPGETDLRQTAWRQGEGLTNRRSFAVDDLPEFTEAEPNDTPGPSQRIDLPVILNGRIGRPGDVDFFTFQGRKGDEVVAEVFGRRLDSPLDSLLRITDATGKVLALNDDREDKWTGLVTHLADSRLLCRLPANGTYCVSVADTQGHGGSEYAYRLRIGPPQPDFDLIVTPSCLNIPAGSTVPVTVHVLRKDGFAGEIKLTLRNPPDGLTLSGGRIPAGQDRVRVTLTAPARRIDRPFPLDLVGVAKIARKTVTRPAGGAEDKMQAFLYRHLVRTEELLVSLTRGRRGLPPMKLKSKTPIRIPPGRSARVRIKIPNLPKSSASQAELVLGEPPEGLSLGDVGITPDGAMLVILADAEKAKVGDAGNLIIEVYANITSRGRGGKGPERTRRVYVGVLPAIPFVIVRR